MIPSLIIHGGAGTLSASSITLEQEQAYRLALVNCLKAGFEVLKGGGSSLNAVTSAVIALEDEPLFNAGKGAVFTAKGNHQLDASLMEGSQRKAGAVAGLQTTRNPILAALAVMEKTEHVLLCGSDADSFAASVGLEQVTNTFFSTEFRRLQWEQVKGTNQIALDHSLSVGATKKGTVGAVAQDSQGHLAAGTSTGGMTNKQWGRVGDSPIIGAGVWADDTTCALSATGHGEFFIKYMACYDVHCLMEYKGLSFSEALEKTVLEKLHKVAPESGGLIGISSEGETLACFNSEGMYRAWVSYLNGEPVFNTAIYR